MKKKLLFVLLFALANLASAQTPASASASTPLVDHWATAEECLAAPANTPYYYPTILHAQKLGKNEVVYGLPRGGCTEMDLPDRLNKRGFVQIQSDRPLVYDRATGKMLRLKECNNKIYSFVPFPPTVPVNGKDGIQGPPGPPGRDGIDGLQGPPGRDGRNGIDGRHIVVTAIPVAKKGHGKLIGILVAVGAAAAVGIVVGTQHKNQPPAVTTLPPTGSGLPVVTTLPPGPGH